MVGRSGGLPMLPDDMPWPVWKFSAEMPEAPLAYIAGIDCGAVPAHQLDIPLHTTGTLHFFHFYDCFEDEPHRHGGSRVYYVPAGADIRERPAPPTPYVGAGYDPLVRRPMDLRAQLIGTAPSSYSAFRCAAFWRPPSDYVFGEEPSWVYLAQSDLELTFSDEFQEAVYQENRKFNGHQLGGHTSDCQNPPENDMWPRPDYPFRGGDGQSGTTAHGQADPTLQPGRLLFAIDGGELDGGDYKLHWLIRPSDLAALRFEAAAFRQTSG